MKIFNSIRKEDKKSKKKKCHLNSLINLSSIYELISYHKP